MSNIRKDDCTSAPTGEAFDEKVKKIIKLLPGGDCRGYGGCGHKSCKACAEAIVSGAPTNLCPACKTEAVVQIAEILGVTPAEVTENQAFIKCGGDAAGKKRLAGCSSCEDAKKDGFMPGECQYGCMGIGSCIERCNFDAMKLVDGNIVIDEEKCNGCMACIGVCPNELIIMVPKEATNFIPCASKNDEETTRAICGHGCIGCGECETACPQDAVQIINNCAVIDYDKCVGCVACTVKCKKKIIVDKIHDLTKVKDTVAFVKCRGGKKTKAKFDALGIENCKDASKVRSAAMGLCTYGCVGLGECTEVCRFDAIHIVDGTAKVDPEKCVGCLDCTFACPNKLIEAVPYKGSKLVACSSTANREEKQKVCDTGCIGCADCASNCPNGAVSVINNCAAVDTALCENCGVCTYMCSRHVLTEQAVEEYNYLQHKALGI